MVIECSTKPAAPTIILPTPPTFPDPIPDVLPFGTVTIFAGAAGVGKTAMLADWIARWRTGRTIWGHQTNAPTAFGYLAADRQWKSHQKWFDLVGYSDIPHYSLADDTAFKLEDLARSDQALGLFSMSLRKVMNGQPPPPGAHIIVDPVTPLFIVGSPNNSRDVARSLLYMSRECQLLQINLTLVGHFAKQLNDAKTRYTRPQDRIAGSGAFAGYSDTQMYLCDPEPPDQPHHLFGWVPRHLPPQAFSCQRLPREHEHSGLFTPINFVVEDLTAGQVFDCLAAGELIVAAGEWFSSVERTHKHSRATFVRAVERLLEQGRVERVSRGRYRRSVAH